MSSQCSGCSWKLINSVEKLSKSWEWFAIINREVRAGLAVNLTLVLSSWKFPCTIFENGRKGRRETSGEEGSGAADL